MGEWKPGEWYDDGAWMGERKYRPRWPGNYATVRFAQQAMAILRLAGPAVSVLDLGSGNGMFAAMLWHCGHRGQYVGADFSPGSVRYAVEGNRDHGGHQNARFDLVDLERANVAELLAGYFAADDDVLVTSGECLEHMKEDRRLVATIPEGTLCVISVPRFGGQAHIRWWFTREQLEAYWAPFFTPDSWVWSWVSTKLRSDINWCHAFTGVRNGWGRDVEWPETFGCPPLVAAEHAVRATPSDNDGEAWERVGAAK